jgi:hypothetical protein
LVDLGGIEQFKANRRRDAKKLKLCQKNGVSLIYVRPDYILEKVIKDILDAQPPARADD